MIETADTGREMRRAAIAMLAAATLAAMLMALQPVRSPDVWHHIKSGELVAQHGPARTDPFSCTAQGQPWIQYEWMAQLAFYGVWAASGAAGLMTMQVGMIGLTAVLLLWAAQARVANAVGAQHAAPLQTHVAAASALAVALAMCAASDRIFTRPELFSWAILAAWLVALEKLRGGRLRWIIPLPILMALWVNLHGAWPAGLALSGLVCGAETILALVRRPSALPRRTLTALWGAFGLAVVATLANPYGIAIWEVPFKLAQSPVVRASILEWQRPDWDDWLTVRNLGMAALLAGLIAAPRALKLRDCLVLLFFGALAFTARRHIAVAMLVASPILAVLLAAALSRLGKRSEDAIQDSGCRIQDSGVRSPRPPRLCGEPFVFVAALVVVACLLLSYVSLGFRLERAGWGLKERAYPIAAAEFLARNRLDGNLFNSYAYGNYLLFARWPQNRVFIDGRVDMYGARVVGLYNTVRLAAAGWREELAQREISLCVLEITRNTDEKLLRTLYRDPGWAMAYWDADCAIFVQRVPAREEFLKQARVWRYLPSLFSPESLPSRDEVLRAEAEFRLKLEEDPACVPALFALARAEGALGHPENARALLEKAVELEPQNAVMHYELGALMMEKGALPEAEKEFRRAIALGGQQGSAHLALSVIRQKQQDLPGAVREARAALTFAPDNWKIHWNLSILYEQQNQLDKAIAEAEEALRLQPKMPDAVQRLAGLRAKSGAGRTP